jgi:hypothetical protein
MGKPGFGHGHVRWGLRGALLAGSGLLAVACSSAAPQTFHPASDNSSAASSSAAPSAPAGALTLIRPPFGRHAHVLMTPWMPGRPGEKAAVMAAKDFVLAVLYADYTGDRDQRWRSYVTSPRVRTGLAQTLHVPSVTTESFTGTVRFWRMSAIRAKGTVIVTECVDTARARNTSLSTGKILPPGQQTPRNQNYYSNSDVLARESSGRWEVVSIPTTVYYPQAQECKP